ncbi:DUF6538 domain-containing protein [Pseudomonas sp. S2_E01]
MAHSSGMISRSSQRRPRSFMAQPFKHPTSGVFYLRRRVPDELRPALGREYKRSLSTRDPNEAKARFASEWSKSEEAFSAARARLSGVEGLSARDVQQLAARWFRSQLDEMERTGEFNTYLVPGSISGWETRYGWEEHQEMLSIQQGIEEGDETDWHATARVNIRRSLKAEGIPMPPKGSKTLDDLELAFYTHLLKLSNLAKQRADGDWLAKVEILSHEPLAAQQNATPKTPTVLEAFEAYAKSKILDDGDTRSTKKTIEEFRSTIKRFIELFGDLPTSTISRGKVQEYRAKLALLPVKTKGAGNMTAPELIANADAKSLQRLAPATIRNRLRALSAVLGYAVRLGWISENPVEASGIAKAASKSATGKGSRRRKDYTQAELKTIFHSKAFTQEGWNPPRRNFGKAWYWAPLLMYYTGARREEIAQLAAKDVLRSEEGIPYLSILAEPENGDAGRTVKSESSRRLVPLHDHLIKLGLLDYVETLSLDGQLFPLLKANPAGFYGANWGKAWAEYLRNIVDLQSPASPSHGFRHTFKTLSRQVGIPEEVHDALTGHSNGSVGRDYGNMPLTRMAEELRKFPLAPLP